MESHLDKSHLTIYRDQNDDGYLKVPTNKRRYLKMPIFSNIISYSYYINCFEMNLLRKRMTLKRSIPVQL
jgi:hypothetical protein